MDMQLFRTLLQGDYKFSETPEDWDVGRSGKILRAQRKKDGKNVVIKGADSSSPGYEEAKTRLRNESQALQTLGKVLPSHLPEWVDFEKGDCSQPSYSASWLILSEITSKRVEKIHKDLDETTRKEIARQLLTVLAEAHQKKITNRDVDLKHLYWDGEKQVLTIIDWGNAHLEGESAPADFAQDLWHGIEILQTVLPELENASQHVEVIRKLYEWKKNATVPVGEVGDKLPPYDVLALKEAFEALFPSENGGARQGTKILQGIKSAIPAKLLTLLVTLVILALLASMCLGACVYSFLCNNISNQPSESPPLTSTPTASPTPTPTMTAPASVESSPTSTPSPTLTPVPVFPPLSGTAEPGFRTVFNLFSQDNFTQLPLFLGEGTPMPSKQGLYRTCPTSQTCQWSFGNLTASQKGIFPDDLLLADLTEIYPPDTFAKVRRISLMGQFLYQTGSEQSKIGLFWGDEHTRVETVLRIIDGQNVELIRYDANGQEVSVKKDIPRSEFFWLYVQFSGNQVEVYLAHDASLDNLKQKPLEQVERVVSFSLQEPLENLQRLGMLGRGPNALLNIYQFKAYLDE